MTHNVPQLSTTSVPSDHEMAVYLTMAKQAVASKMYRGIGEENGIMMIMLAARELGIPAMQALNGGLHLIQGKVEISARMMSALIRRAGHSLQIEKLDEKECWVKGKRADNGDEGVAVFTMEEAQRAGLIKKGGGWEKFPKDMLYARALSRLSRQLFSDVVGVGYVEGEISQQTPKERPLEQAECEVVEEEGYKPYQEEVFKHLDKEECLQFVEYANIVMVHFKWSETKTWRTFAQSFEETYAKFQAWREKNKGGVNAT